MLNQVTYEEMHINNECTTTILHCSYEMINIIYLSFSLSNCINLFFYRHNTSYFFMIWASDIEGTTLWEYIICQRRDVKGKSTSDT